MRMKLAPMSFSHWRSLRWIALGSADAEARVILVPAGAAERASLAVEDEAFVGVELEPAEADVRGVLVERAVAVLDRARRGRRGCGVSGDQSCGVATSMRLLELAAGPPRGSSARRPHLAHRLARTDRAAQRGRRPSAPCRCRSRPCRGLRSVARSLDTSGVSTNTPGDAWLVRSKWTGSVAMSQTSR